MEDKNPIQVAGRLFGALEYLAEHGACGLTELADALDLNKSTTHRIVSSLQYMGYVKQDTAGDKYEVTLKLVELSNHIIGKIDIIDLVRPKLRQLMERTGETVHFVRLEGSDVVYIDKVEANQNMVRMVSQIGSRIPFYRSGVGKAMAAQMRPERVKQLWGQCTIERMTPYTITNLEDFMDALEEVRRKGYALDNEENETGVRCIAVALNVHDTPSAEDTEPEYAISISVPINRMDNDRIRELSGYILSTKQDIEKTH